MTLFVVMVTERLPLLADDEFQSKDASEATQKTYGAHPSGADPPRSNDGFGASSPSTSPISSGDVPLRQEARLPSSRIMPGCLAAVIHQISFQLKSSLLYPGKNPGSAIRFARTKRWACAISATRRDATSHGPTARNATSSKRIDISVSLGTLEPPEATEKSAMRRTSTAPRSVRTVASSVLFISCQLPSDSADPPAGPTEKKRR